MSMSRSIWKPSEHSLMPPRFGIDTSILVRLLTGKPDETFDYCVARMTELIENDGAEIFASNQVIGEAYIALQHHYNISKADARIALLSVLRSGLVSPMNGQSVILALEAPANPGLLDRLIAEDYTRADLETLTLDRKMATLPATRQL